MRKLILIAAVSLFASHAHAGGPRSLSLAATDASQRTTEQPTTTAEVPPQATQAPAPNVQTATAAPTSTSTPAAPPAATAGAAQIKSTAAPVAGATETAKPKRRQSSTEARVIRELHRHGIYW